MYINTIHIEVQHMSYRVIIIAAHRHNTSYLVTEYATMDACMHVRMPVHV